MTKISILIILFVSLHLFGQNKQTQILILGSDHFSQLYKNNNLNTDILAAQNQKSIDEFNNLLAKYQPDIIMVEELAESQNRIDSFYTKFKNNTLDFNTIENGRSEIFQIAFNVGKKLNIPKIYCVNAVGGISESILDNGDNIQIYKDYTSELRKVGMEKYKSLASGELSFKQIF